MNCDLAQYGRHGILAGAFLVKFFAMTKHTQNGDEQLTKAEFEGLLNGVNWTQQFQANNLGCTLVHVPIPDVIIMTTPLVSTPGSTP